MLLGKGKKSALLIIPLALMAALLAACSTVTGQPEPRPQPIMEVQAGRKLIAAYGCGTCHTIAGIPGADGIAGPPLNSFYERSTIAGLLANTKDNLVRWISNPQAVQPGVDMPNLGIPEADARDMAAYLYHKPSLLDWFAR